MFAEFVSMNEAKEVDRKSAESNQSMVGGGVSAAVVVKLFDVLKSWSSDMEAFRYEMFARRLVAAEHGRPDAVEWANNWYRDVVEEESARAAELQAQLAISQERSTRLQQALKAGRSSNPHYQAFLDTVEYPEEILDNVPFFSWISALRVKLAQIPGINTMSEQDKQAQWLKLIQDERNANLAPRLRLTLPAE